MPELCQKHPSLHSLSQLPSHNSSNRKTPEAPSNPLLNAVAQCRVSMSLWHQITLETIAKLNHAGHLMQAPADLVKFTGWDETAVVLMTSSSSSALHNIGKLIHQPNSQSNHYHKVHMECNLPASAAKNEFDMEEQTHAQKSKLVFKIQSTKMLTWGGGGGGGGGGEESRCVCVCARTLKYISNCSWFFFFLMILFPLWFVVQAFHKALHVLQGSEQETSSIITLTSCVFHNTGTGIMFPTMVSFTISSCTDLGIQQEIVWLDVSVNEAQLVNGINSQDGLCCVELRLFFWQCVLLHQQCHHITCTSANGPINKQTNEWMNQIKGNQIIDLSTITTTTKKVRTTYTAQITCESLRSPFQGWAQQNRLTSDMTRLNFTQELPVMWGILWEAYFPQGVDHTLRSLPSSRSGSHSEEPTLLQEGITLWVAYVPKGMNAPWRGDSMLIMTQRLCGVINLPPSPRGHFTRWTNWSI